MIALRQGGWGVTPLDFNSNMVSMHGSESHLCRIIFKNLNWTWWAQKMILPKSVNNSPNNFLDQKFLRTIQHANNWSLSKQTGQATKVWKKLFKRRKSVGQCYTFFSWKYSSDGISENLRLLFWPSFPVKKNRFSMEAIQVEVFLYFCFNSFHSFKARLEKHEVLANWFGIWNVLNWVLF